MPTTPLRLAFTCLLLTMVAGCAGNPVKSSGSWAADAKRGTTFTRVLVLGVSPDINQRCAFEDSMVQALQGAGVAAATSCSIIGPKEPLTREAVENAAASVQADAVLATRPLGSSSQLREGGTHETRGEGYYKATGYGVAYDYWGAYGVPVVWGEFQTAPAEFVLEGSARLRAEIYETAGAALVYSLQTEAGRLESRSQALIVITSEIAAQLRKDGVIR